MLSKFDVSQSICSGSNIQAQTFYFYFLNIAQANASHVTKARRHCITQFMFDKMLVRYLCSLPQNNYMHENNEGKCGSDNVTACRDVKVNTLLPYLPNLIFSL